MAGLRGEHGALVEADDVAVAEAAATGLEAAAGIEQEGAPRALGVGDLDALAVAEGAAATGLTEDPPDAGSRGTPRCGRRGRGGRGGSRRLRGPIGARGRRTGDDGPGGLRTALLTHHGESSESSRRIARPFIGATVLLRPVGRGGARVRRPRLGSPGALRPARRRPPTTVPGRPPRRPGARRRAAGAGASRASPGR